MAQIQMKSLAYSVAPKITLITQNDMFGGELQTAGTKDLLLELIMEEISYLIHNWDLILVKGN